ncbi:MAG: PIN domain-containing protein [Synergistaceae bacterium]|nr:PIN domain-containing protein [Synergistaceae bacterium]
MIKVLIDTNVILNYLTGREDKYLEESIQVMSMCSQNKIKGYVAFHSLSIIWYTSVRMKMPEEVRREWLDRVCTVLTTSSANHDLIVGAVHNTKFRDFEDNLQECCAVSAGADYIVTVNVKDYENSRVKAVTPDQLVKIMNAI